MSTRNTGSIRKVLGILAIVAASALMIPFSYAEGEATEFKWSFKSREALQAKAQYDADAAEADAKHRKELDAARAKLLESLESAKTKATKDGDLDDALKIRTAIERVTSGQELKPRDPAGESKTRQPSGKWNLVKANGVLGTYQFRPDGSVNWTEKDRTTLGKATAKDGVIVVVYPDDRTERMTWSGRRLIVEHWVPSANYPAKFPTTFGYAEPAP